MPSISIDHDIPQADWDTIASLFDGMQSFTTDKSMWFDFDTVERADAVYQDACKLVGSVYLKRS